jgi:hypothetical protein
MVPHDVRAHLPRRFALFALITLCALAMCSPLVSSARSAFAAPARFVLASAVLAASPTNLTNCRQCMVTVSNQSPTRSLTWFAISRGISGVTMKPARGMLQPKGRVSVTVAMPSNIPCPANDTITFTGPVNSVKVSWSCMATPTPTPTLALTPTTAPTPSPMPSASPTQTDSSLTSTPTPVPNGGGQHDNGNPPGRSGSQGSSVPSILLSVAALLLALLAFTLYLISPAKASLRNRLLSLFLPVSFLRRLDQNPW